MEPMLKSQWFLDCREMAARAREVVENESLQIHPKHYKRTWFHHTDKCKLASLHHIPIKCIQYYTTLFLVLFVTETGAYLDSCGGVIRYQYIDCITQTHR